MTIRILITCLFGLSLQVMAQQPANTFNVKTQGGATGNGTTNDTAAIQNTLNAANATGRGVYFPAGTYIVNGISIPDNTSIFGDKAGISLVKSVQPYKTVNMTGDDDDVGETIGNLRIEDLFFLNMRFTFQNNAMANLAMSRCVIATDKIAPDGQGWMMSEWDGDDMIVEDCIFLSGHETGEWLGGRIKAIKASKTKGMRIRRNIIGMDMGNISWLATEWQGYANWTNAVGRLNQFKTEQNLPRRMGEMAGGIAIFDGTENVIEQNIIHLDFEANLAGGMDEDHLIYSLRETKIEITRNWLSGHPNTAGGGLKHRDTDGPGVIAANYLNDAPLLLYSYGDPNSTPIDYDYLFPFDNQLIFRNYLKVTPQRVLGNAITGGSSRYGFNFMSDDGNTGKEIDVAENLFDLAANIQNQGINLAQGKTTADGWRIYESNFHVSGVNSGELVEIRGRNLTPGAYDYFTVQKTPTAPYLGSMNADMAKYEAMEIPCLDIPPYGADPVGSNNPPVFTNSPFVAPSATINAAYSGSIANQASDADSNPLTFYKITGPRWLVVATNGALIGNPTLADVGLNNFTVQVSDGITSVTTTMQITVQPVPPSSYTLTYIAGANGSLGGTTQQTVNAGASGAAVTAVALTGYRFINWSDGSTANPRTEVNVTASLNVTAIFAVIPGYLGWLAAFPSIAESTPDTDTDGDGMTNFMEYTLGGNPIIHDATTALPKVQTTPSGARFTFRRSDASEIEIALGFQYTYDLSNETVWSEVVIGANSSETDLNGVQITVEENNSEPDVIRITLPVGSNHRIFGRIRASAIP